MLIPGLWFPAQAMRPLACRLMRRGFVIHAFSYRSVRADLKSNSDRLAEFLGALPADTVHLVGHSLGGILIRALFHFHPDQRPGRIVTLGTPHGGSRVARHLSRHAFWRRVMGKSVAQLLAGEPQQWISPAREAGAICGVRSFGLGRCMYRGLPRPNDGLLTVKESAFPAARAHLALPVSHTGMLFSRQVAEEVAYFLARGEFGCRTGGKESS